MPASHIVSSIIVRCMVFMLMLLLRMVNFSRKQFSLGKFILFATYVLHCRVCSTVVPRYLYSLYCVSRCPFTFLTLFPMCFRGDNCFCLLGIHFHSILFAGCIIVYQLYMLKLWLTLCQYDCVIGISDFS